MPSSSVLVFTPYCPGSIGEQIVQLPLLASLRRSHPGARLVAVSPERSHHVLTALGAVDEVVEHPAKPSLAEQRGVLRRLGGRKVVAVVQNRRLSGRTALLARLSAVAPMIGFDHGVSRLLQARSHPWDDDLYIAENYLRLGTGTLEDYAADRPAHGHDETVLCPGGLADYKRWPFDRYLALAERLAAARPVRFLLGPDEATEAERLAADGRFPATLTPGFDEMERLVAGAALVVANDCGPAHFAHLHDVPRVSLFDRHIEPGLWFRPGRHGRLVLSPGKGELARVTVDEVIAAVEAVSGDGGL
jgi:ADP-heptose:LPS heptosyltransferase